MADRGLKKTSEVTVTSRQRSSSEDSSDRSSTSRKAPSLKSPRTARFAEATAVNSPIDQSDRSRLPFARQQPPPSTYYMAQPQVSDVGFGYVNRHESVEMPNTDDYEYPTMTPRTPMKSPLKSAMKTPGAPPRDFGGILSPTFKEEELVEKAEKHTDKQQARDVAIKARVRLAKFFLRGMNFSCSLVVLSMLLATFQIFNASQNIPPRNGLPPWAPNTETWPQYTLLAVACVSLVTSVMVFYGYYRAGHRGGSKYANYYQWVSMGWFMTSIIMWVVGAAILQHSRDKEQKQNLWGWSCNQNSRRELFQNDVSYDLVCRLQNWSLLCCIIEVVVETITIAVYGVVIHRIYAKTKLRKSMAVRDLARSDLYTKQLHSENVPQTPGFNIPYTPRAELVHEDPQAVPAEYYKSGAALEEGVQYVNADRTAAPAIMPFVLQAPPQKGPTPKMHQTGFSPTERTPSPPRIIAPEDDDERSPFLNPPDTMVHQHQQQQQYHQQQQQQHQQHFPYPLSPAFAPHAMDEEAPQETQQQHFTAAPGEHVYDDVPIPGAYEPPPLSPSVAAAEQYHYQQQQQGYFGQR